MQNRKLLTKGLCVMMSSCMLVTSAVPAMAAEVPATTVTPGSVTQEAFEVTEGIIGDASNSAVESEIVREIPISSVAKNEVDAHVEEERAKMHVENASDEYNDKDVAKEIVENLDNRVKDENGNVVEGKENLGNQTSFVDDKAIDTMNQAEEKVNSANDIMDDELDPICEQIKGGFTNLGDAQTALENLMEVQGKADSELVAANAKLGEAKTNLETAENNYKAAEGLSAEVQKAALAELDAAKAHLEQAEADAEAAKDRVDKVYGVLSSIQTTVEEWKEGSAAALETSKEMLDEATKKQETAVEELKAAGGEVAESAKQFGEDFDAFKTAAGDFIDAVKDAKDAQEVVDGMKKEYEETQKNFQDMEKAYYDTVAAVLGITVDEAKNMSEKEFDDKAKTLGQYDAIYGENGLKKSYDAAKDSYDNINVAYNALYSEAQVAKAADYLETVNGLKTQIANPAEDADVAALQDELCKTVVEFEIVKNGQELKKAELNEAGKYVVKFGEEEIVSDTPFYAVIGKDAEGKDKFEGAYTSELTLNDGTATGDVTIKTIGYEALNDYVTVTGDENHYQIRDNGTKVIINGEAKDLCKDADGNYFVKNDVADVDTTKTRDILDQPTVVGFSVGDLFSIGNLTVKYNDNKDPYVEITNGKKYSLVKYESQNCYLSADLKTITVKYSYRIPFTQKWIDETKTINVKGEKWNQQNIVTITVDGTVYTADAGENGKNITDFVDKDGNKLDSKYFYDLDAKSYKVRQDVTRTTNGVKLTASTNDSGKTSLTYSTELAKVTTAEASMNDALKDFNEAKGAWEQLQQDARDKQDAMAEAKRLADEKDLGVLAMLPTSVFDVVGTGKIDSIEDVTAVIKAINNLSTEVKLKDLKTLNDLLDLGLDLNDLDLNALGDFTEALTDKNSAKGKYLDAWVEMVKAKAAVVTTGFELVEATTTMVNSGIAVLAKAEEVGLADKTAEALITSLEAAALAGATATLEVSTKALTLADIVVTQLTNKVGEYKEGTDKAYNDVLTAQKALDALTNAATNNGPKQADLEAAKKALADAQAEYDRLVKALADAKRRLKEADAYKAAAQAEVDRLTPRPVAPTPGTTDEPEIDPYAGYDQTAVAALLNATVVPVLNAAAQNTPVVAAAAAANAANEAEAVTIGDEQVALGVEEVEEVSPKSLSTISDDAVPLSIEKNNSVIFGIIGLLIALLVAAYLYIRKTSKMQAQ